MTTKAEDAHCLQVLPLVWQSHSVDLSLSPNMGALWRSGLGLALAEVDADAFALFFGLQQSGGRLFALRPPLTPIAPAQVFTWGVTLFGEGVRHAASVLEAARRLGEIGVGERRGRYLLLEASDGKGPLWSFDRGVWRTPSAIDGGRWWSMPPQRAAATVTIRTLTPMSFKTQNVWQQGVPTMSLWVRRILGRTAQLCQEASQANPIGRERAESFKQASEAIILVRGQVRPTRLDRVSARSGQRMTVPAQWCTAAYAGEGLSALWPLLKWMELVQIGAKTAFGSGVVQVQ